MTTATPAPATYTPWLMSPHFDGLGILLPPFLGLAFAIYGADRWSDLPPWMFGLFIVAIDVGHVYATLFRTYADAESRQAQGDRLWVVPLAGYLIGLLLYSLGALHFWRVLAYLAAFHFVRQQYGFLRIYSRGPEAQSISQSRWDTVFLYASTVGPLIWWHFQLPRQFEWFMAGDFIAMPTWLSQTHAGDTIMLLYGPIALAWIGKEIRLFRSRRRINVARVGLLLGTALSWWLGIALWDSDIAFTSTNVLAHGIPYLCLVWIHEHKRLAKETALPGNPKREQEREYTPAQTWRTVLFRAWPGFFLMIFVLAVLGYVEEGFWDAWIWRERHAEFQPFQGLPALPASLAQMIVPALALPQIVHYLMDGWIWRFSRDTQLLNRVLSP